MDRIAPKSLLIVDDDQPVRDALVELFDTDENEITAAGTLAGALDALARHTFDLIITALRIGTRATGGLQVMAAAGILSPAATRIVLTTLADVAQREASQRLGATYVVEKPADPLSIAMFAARHGIGSALVPAAGRTVAT